MRVFVLRVLCFLRALRLHPEIWSSALCVACSGYVEQLVSQSPMHEMSHCQSHLQLGTVALWIFQPARSSLALHYDQVLA